MGKNHQRRLKTAYHNLLSSAKKQHIHWQNSVAGGKNDYKKKWKTEPGTILLF